MGKFVDLKGEVFGRLTVVEMYGRNSSDRITWSCLCSCGNSTITTGNSLKMGITKSCGCLRKEIATAWSTTHGMTNHPANQSYRHAKSRTKNPRNKDWKHYGGRGITFSPEWDESFSNFWFDMGPSWQEGLTLDRIDVNGNYCKENCRWVEQAIQVHNRRKQENCSSQYIGVCFTDNTYVAYISVDGKRNHLGAFNCEVTAATVYDNRSEELYGDRPNRTVRHSK